MQNIEDDGLKIPCIDAFIKANRATWTKRLMCLENRISQYLSMFTPDLDIAHYLKCNYNPNDLPPTRYSYLRHALMVT